MEIRRCSQCKQEKELSKEFFNTRDKLGKKFRTDCKECQHLKQSEAYQKKAQVYKACSQKYRAVLKEQNQKLLWEFLLENPCVRCGETNPVILDLDHLRDKRYEISDIIKWHKWDSVLREIDKCQVLCVGCHRKKTAKDFGYYKHIDDIEKFL